MSAENNELLLKIFEVLKARTNFWFHVFTALCSVNLQDPSQWPRGLKRGSAAARLVGLRF